MAARIPQGQHNRMKILFVITRADTVGGAQVHVRDLAQKLHQDQHDVIVVTGTRGPYSEVLDEYDIKNIAFDDFIRSINPLQDASTLFNLVKIIQTFQPDLVSTHSSKAGLLGRLASKIAGVPCLFTAHGWSFTPGVSSKRRILYKTLEKIAEPWAAKIICVSDYDRTLALQAGMSPERLMTIHNGMPHLADDHRANPPASDPVQITMIARFDQQKDQATLIKAFKGIAQAHLNLIGDGPTMMAMQSLVNQLGLADQVRFFGFRPDIPDCLAQSHIFALISNWEGFPRTILEAMRAGLPVVATQVGGVDEAVQDGVTGFCIPRQEVEPLHQRLSQLVADAHLRQQMGLAGRQRYEAEFTFMRMYQQTTDVNATVLAQRGLA